MSFIVAAMPFFLLLIFIELVVDKIRGAGFYRFSDTLASLNLGIFSRFIGLITALVTLSAYAYLFEHYSITQLANDSYITWFFAFIFYDLVYYWGHRLNHRINIMWGSHVVHHSGEEYNLTTALRQSSSPSVFGWVLFLPLAIIGIPPIVIAGCASLNLIYQFWVHTRHINKMPAWFEAVMVTPSHHRVHHALNRQYIDKNFAGVFIVWDKLFNSFQAELEEVEIVYGVSHQLKSWNPVWANLQVYYLLWQDVVNTKAWPDKLAALLKPPGWRPKDMIEQYPRAWVTTKTMVKYDVPLTISQKGYVLGQYLIFLTLTFYFLTNTAMFALPVLMTVSFVGILNLVVISALQEQKSQVKWLEYFRLSLTAAFILVLVPNELINYGIGITSSIVAGSLAAFNLGYLSRAHLTDSVISPSLSEK